MLWLTVKLLTEQYNAVVNSKLLTEQYNAVVNS